MPRLQITDYRLQIRRITAAVFLFSALCSLFSVNGYTQERKEEAIIVNGDTVEYSTEGKEVTATGNVWVTYKGAKLTCNKLTVNTQTKDAQAEGNIRLEDAKGVIEGAKIKYNFQTKTGTIIDAEFRANPYFGKAERVEKVSDSEFVGIGGYATTCNYDNPHYRIGSKKIDIFPGDKIRTKSDVFYMGRTPFLYLPRYNHSLKDPIMHVQVMPGQRKDWGPYLLTATRYNLTENISGRIYLDYREKLGLASGLGSNYIIHRFGRGNYKFYYTNEKPNKLSLDSPQEFERYFMRWRHKWDIDERTNLVSEYYRIVDRKRKFLGSNNNFLKDYFYREYEKDSQPLSYVLMHHSFNYSSLDFLMQERTNHWFDQLDKTPEIKYKLLNMQIGETPFYFENNSSFANLNKKVDVSNTDLTVTRFDTNNKFSLPTKVAFVELVPYIASRQTFYDKDANGSSISPRTVFYTGTDASAKFYRLFDVRSHFLGMDINGLRHIITPTIGYAYNHKPTVSSTRLKQIDEVDSLANNNSISLALSNKLQTKRKGQTVDLTDFRVSSGYTLYAVDPQSNVKSHGSFSDFLFNLKLLPYSWMRIDSDATYKSDGDYFSNANYDIHFDLGKERSFSAGQRYQAKGGNEITCGFDWRLNPKWKFSFYERYNRGHDPALIRGLREQEYAISRDLHCWIWDITYNVKKGEGSTIWFIFRLKAFPEMEFGFNQSYHSPSSGSQSNP